MSRKCSRGKNNMFSKPIFKQSIQANWKLWVIITFVAAMILSAFTVTFDAEGFAAIASAAEGTRFSNILSTMTSLLGSLENFYKLIAVILGIVYVVATDSKARVVIRCIRTVIQSKALRAYFKRALNVWEHTNDRICDSGSSLLFDGNTANMLYSTW